MKYIIVFIKYLTIWTKFKDVKIDDVKVTIIFLYENVFICFIYPKIFINDKGKFFRKKIINNMVNLF
jgi:hypothetical protein